jgi:hypothetical protein
MPERWGSFLVSIAREQVPSVDEMNPALHILDVTEDPTLAPAGNVHHAEQGTLFDFWVIR